MKPPTFSLGDTVKLSEKCFPENTAKFPNLTSTIAEIRCGSKRGTLYKLQPPPGFRTGLEWYLAQELTLVKAEGGIVLR